jgi:ATP-dependent helicase/DNAse subunit B
VDYKTGNTEFNKELVKHGLSLQLPIYSLLIKKNYPEYSQTGIYIQNVLSDDKNIDDIYKLTGITINSNEKLARLEHSLSGSSKYINQLTMNKSGYKKVKSLIEEDEFDSLRYMAEIKIEEVVDKIRNGNFHISPLYLDGEDQVCKNCPLISVCLKNDKDHRYEDTNIEEE